MIANIVLYLHSDQSTESVENLNTGHSSMVELIKPTSFDHRTQISQKSHVPDFGHKLRPDTSEESVAPIVQGYLASICDQNLAHGISVLVGGRGGSVTDSN